MTNVSELAGHLSELIESEYVRGGYRDGWRLLASPMETMAGAEVAFVGLNPGGQARDGLEHPQLCMPPGQSGYVHERWKGRPPGEAPLQLQVRAVCERLDVDPVEVLAGNLVPFRSRDWVSLANPREAMVFGQRLWKVLLDSARPRIIVTMGGTTFTAVADLVGARQVARIPFGWGTERAYRAEFDHGRLIGLPHLSRRPIMQRPQSQPGLAILFA
jgi:hypothetical protein